MREAIAFRVVTTDGTARSGVLSTPHGDVPTPAFMPVGTRAAVRAVDSADLRSIGADIVLANTYHLMLRPGAELVADLGGLHEFMSWARPILTDSGGYQVCSLAPKITDEGVVFRSSYDGALVNLTPEDAVRIQELLGSDIAMVLDVCVGLPAPRFRVEEAAELTRRWAERALRVRSREDRALFGIVQGGTEPDLRARSAAAIAELGFPGFGIGGLSVGETSAERNRMIDIVVAELPADRPRYTMGLGDAEGVLAAVARGVDLFDCVWPTRLARHGRVLTPDGDFSLRRAENRGSSRNLQDDCPCATCRTYSRAYLRHLFTAREIGVLRLLTIHNLTYTLGILRDARAAIETGTFADYADRTLARRVPANSDKSLR